MGERNTSASAPALRGLEPQSTPRHPPRSRCVKALDQPTPDEGAQDACAGSGLHLGHGSLVKAAGRVKVHARRYCEGGFLIARYRLKHAHQPRRHANAHGCSGWSQNEVSVQTNLYSSYVVTKSGVNEGHCAGAQGGLVNPRSAGAMLAHALLNELDLMFGNRSNTVYLSAQSIEDAVLDAELVIGGRSFLARRRPSAQGLERGPWAGDL